MDANEYVNKARRIVYNYALNHLDVTDAHSTFALDEVYVVWFAKTLQNWKALVSTTLPDGMYYEVTYNGDKKESYLDAYKKFDNIAYPDDQVDLSFKPAYAPTIQGAYKGGATKTSHDPGFHPLARRSE